MTVNFREVLLVLYLVELSTFALFSEPFTWIDQDWESDQERDFWLALPDWGERELDFHEFRYYAGGKRVEGIDDSFFSGFAKGYFKQEGTGNFRFVTRLENGWVVMIKILSPGGKNHNLRSYQKGALLGRYIDWHPNGERLRDGHAWGKGKTGLWTEWHPNGQKKEEGVWENGKPVGIFEEWYENGQKATEQIFKEGRLSFGIVWKPNGEKCKKSRVTQETGVLLSYNLDGEIVEERIIKNGKRVAQ